MSTSALDPVSPHPDGPTDAIPVLNVVVAYADRATHQRALRIHDHLSEELDDEFDVQFTWWKFDFLTHPDMFESAVAAALHADLIVFSVHAGERLPAHVLAWIEAWKHKRERRQSALVALIGENHRPAGSLSNLHSYLRGLAEETSMEFFPHSFSVLSETPCALLDAASERATRITPLLDEILTRNPATPRWGINE